MIRRAPRDGGFTTLENETLEDDALSWEATGLLVFLLSKPDNWEVRVQHLINYRDAGRHKIKRILSELEDAGYLVRHRVQDDEGKFDWESVIFETPKDDDSSIPRKSVDGSSVDGSSVDGSPVDGKPVDITKTEGSNNGSTNEGKSDYDNAREAEPTDIALSEVDDSVDAITEAVFGAPVRGLSTKDEIRTYCERAGPEGWDCLRSACHLIQQKGWNPTAQLVKKKLREQLELLRETDDITASGDAKQQPEENWKRLRRAAEGA